MSSPGLTGAAVTAPTNRRVSSPGLTGAAVTAPTLTGAAGDQYLTSRMGVEWRRITCFSKQRVSTTCLPGAAFSNMFWPGAAFSNMFRPGAAFSNMFRPGATPRRLDARGVCR